MDDDVYKVRIGSTLYTLADIAGGGGGVFGYSGVRWISSSADISNSRGASLYLFDVDDALSDTLDFVQLAYLYAFPDAVVDATQTAFIAFGNETAPDDMPVSGAASFTGRGLGYYYGPSGGGVVTNHDVALSANFSTGVISGAATNFAYWEEDINASDAGVWIRVPLPEANFTFDALIASGTSGFSGTAVSSGLGISGEIEGAFFGDEGQPPEEAGLAYELGDPTQGAYLAGGAVLVRDPP